MTAFPTPGRPDLPFNPLILSVNINGIVVDFLLTTPGYEELLIQRAIHYSIEDLSLRICTAEDLIIQKALAGRSKDWQDIQGIVIEQVDTLDQMYIEELLRQFVDILDQSELLIQYQNIRENVVNLRSKI